jgi:hypothetical protein
MKKRLLLMLIAVVCLSPSIVFAADFNGFVGNGPTMWIHNPDGTVTSEKGGVSTLGSYERAPASSGSAPANPAPPCAIAAARIDENNKLIQTIQQNRQTAEQKTQSGDAIN